VNSKNDFGVLILSGGMSERMAYPKAFLPFNTTHNFIEQILVEYQLAACNKQVLVLNHALNTTYWQKKLSNISAQGIICWNNKPAKGRLYSIAIGLEAFEEAIPVFIQNVDQPFITHQDISKMMLAYTNKSYCQPINNNLKAHPVLINPEMASLIKKKHSSHASLKTVLQDFKVTLVPVNNSKINVNINSLPDYKTHFAALSKMTER